MSNHGVVAETDCPYCGYRLDDASAVEGQATPKPEDLSVCLKCGGVMEFDAQLLPRVLRDAVWQSLAPELQAQLKRVSQAAREMHR